MVPGRRVRSFRGSSPVSAPGSWGLGFTGSSPVLNLTVPGSDLAWSPHARSRAPFAHTFRSLSSLPLSLLTPPLAHSSSLTPLAHSSRSFPSHTTHLPSPPSCTLSSPPFTHPEQQPTQCDTAPRPAANGWSPSRTTFTSARSTRREIRRWPTTRACFRALAATPLSAWGAANPGPTPRASRVRRRPRLPSESAGPAWWRLILRFHRICGEMKP